MMEYKMVEQFEYKGVWFLPTAKSNRVSGTLYYNADEGITLELFGDFNDHNIAFLFGRGSENDIDIILGLTDNNKKVTLYENFLKSRNVTTSSELKTSSASYVAQFAFVGIHIDKPEDIKFDKLVAEMANLYKWVGISGFIFDIDKEAESLENKVFQINYKLPNTIKFSLSDSLDGQFNFFIRQASEHSIYHESATLEQRVRFGLEYKQEQSFEKILDDLYKFQKILTIALYEQTMSTKISLSNENDKIYWGNHHVSTRKVKLFFRGKKCNDKIKKISDMLFCYKDIKDIFPEIIKNWFDKYKDFESAFNLLVKQFYNDVFTTDTFLNLAQAAESFHAHSNLNIPKRPKTKDDILWEEEILNSVDEKHHSRLKGLFNKINNSSLYTRLKEIVDFCSCDTLDKIIEDKNTFITQVKNSRNYYTHYSFSLEKDALTGIELLNLTQKLKLLLTCAFLIEIGIDKVILDNTLKNRMYKFYYPVTGKNSSSTALESK